MTEQLESLVKDWEKLKENGNGYITCWSMASKGLGNFKFKVPYSTEDYKGIIVGGLRFGEMYVELDKIGLLIDGYSCFKDPSGRFGCSHEIYLEGDYNTLKKTLLEFEKNPRDAIRRFVSIVFGWENTNPQEVPFTATPFGWYGDKIQPDITSEMKRLYILDVGDGYGILKRLSIKFRGNPDVKVIEIK